MTSDLFSDPNAWMPVDHGPVGHGGGAPTADPVRVRDDEARSWVWADTESFFRDAVAHAKTGYSSHREHSGDSWDLNAGWDGAVELARTGWREGAARVRQISEPLADRLSFRVRRDEIVGDFVGEWYDLDDVLRGEPQAWRRLEHQDCAGVAPATTVRIVANLTASGGISASTLVRRGAAVVAIAAALNAARIPCEVWAVVAVRPQESRLAWAWKVQPAGAYLSVEQLAYWLGHPAAFRRLWFGVVENLLKPERLYDRYSPVDVTPEEIERLTGAPASVYLPEAHLNDDAWSSDEKTAAWVEQWLMAAGVIG